MRRPGGLLLIACAVLGGATSQSAHAEVFKPTRFDDPVPLSSCQRNDCSLREALLEANADSDTDTIVLARGTYEIEVPPVAGDLGQDNGDLDITKPVNLVGKGPRKTTLDANGLDRALFIADDLSGKRTTLRSLGVTNGDPTALSDPSQVPLGGGIWMYTGKVLLDRVSVRNSEAQFGGGIRAQSTKLTIKRSTIAGNNAAEGGGIQTGHRVFDPAVTRVLSSTISGNYASKGGGILADGFTSSPTPELPEVYLVNSTVAQNHTSSEGGGIMADNSAKVSLDNSTVAYNLADDDNTGGGHGGGIHQHSGASFEFHDSLLAANQVGTSGSGPACDGTFAGEGSIVDNTGTNPTCSWTGPPPLFTAAPRIGPLAKNGGPTKTVKIKAASPANGASVDCPGRDQRGVKRPNAGCDSGAYERTGP